MECSFDSRMGKVAGMIRDTVSWQVYVSSDRRVTHVVITDEDRNVWKLYIMRAAKEDPWDAIVA